MGRDAIEDQQHVGGEEAEKDRQHASNRPPHAAQQHQPQRGPQLETLRSNQEQAEDDVGATRDGRLG